MSKRDIPYGVRFDTRSIPGRIEVVKVTLGITYIGPEERVRLDLSDHPLYEALEQYVLDNPSGKVQRTK